MTSFAARKSRIKIAPQLQRERIIIAPLATFTLPSRSTINTPRRKSPHLEHLCEYLFDLQPSRYPGSTSRPFIEACFETVKGNVLQVCREAPTLPSFSFPISQ